MGSRGVQQGAEGGGRPLDDGKLVERARSGDLHAYADLVRRHQGTALRVAYVVCGSHEDAEEAVQSALVKAHGALGRFRAEAPFRPWLLTIVANEARNQRRAAGRRATLAVRMAAEVTSGEASAASPEVDLVAREQVQTVLAALDRLKERDRLVVAYRYLLDLTERETAQILGVRPGTVKSRLSRALARLREDLSHPTSPPPGEVDRG